MTLKLSCYFYLLMEKPLGCYFSLVFLLSGCTVQGNKVTGQVWESQKRISIKLITDTTSFHLPMSISTDLMIQIKFSVLTNAVGKRWSDRLVDVIIRSSYKVYYCDTITRKVPNQGYRATFTPWGKSDPAGHQPSTSMSRISQFFTVIKSANIHWKQKKNCEGLIIIFSLLYFIRRCLSSTFCKANFKIREDK